MAVLLPAAKAPRGLPWECPVQFSTATTIAHTTVATAAHRTETQPLASRGHIHTGGRSAGSTWPTQVLRLPGPAHQPFVRPHTRLTKTPRHPGHPSQPNADTRRQRRPVQRGLAEGQAGPVARSAAGDPRRPPTRLSTGVVAQCAFSGPAGCRAAQPGAGRRLRPAPGRTCLVHSPQACAHTPRPCNNPKGDRLGLVGGFARPDGDVGRIPSQLRPPGPSVAR